MVSSLSRKQVMKEGEELVFMQRSFFLGINSIFFLLPGCFKLRLVLQRPEEGLAGPRAAIQSLLLAMGMGFLYCEGEDLLCTAELLHLPQENVNWTSQPLWHCAKGSSTLQCELSMSPALHIAGLGAQRSLLA